MERATVKPKSPSLLPLIIHQLKLKRQQQTPNPPSKPSLLRCHGTTDHLHGAPNPPSKPSLLRCHGTTDHLHGTPNPPSKASLIRTNDDLNLHETRQIHAHMVVTRFDHASQTIPATLRRRLTSPESQYNFLVTSYNRSGSQKTSLAIYAHLRRTGDVDAFTVPSVLKACGECSLLGLGREIHGYALKSGIDRDAFVRNALMRMYGECGSVDLARRLFDEMTDKDSVSWNTMIRSCVRNGFLGEALGFVQNFFASGIELDETAMLGISNLIIALNDAAMAKAMHGYIVRHGIFGVKLATSLIDMYGKSGNSAYAIRFFKGSSDSQESVVAWTAIIKEAIRSNLMNGGITLIRQMLKSGIVPNEIMLLSLFSECGFAGALHTGRMLHTYIDANDITVSPALAATIVDMYGRCGNLLSARNFFNHCSHRDSGIWNAMISAYTRADHIYEARSLFAEMAREGMKMNPATIASLIALCSEVGSLELGKWVHSQINEQGMDVDLVVKTSLLDMYAKCGDLTEAQRLFVEATERDVCMWNAMMTGFAMHGCGNKALELFSEMEKLGVKPNEITFVAVLNACSHAGQVCQGKSLFDKMVRFYGLVPEIKHYGCMVDLLGRAGRLAEAREFIDRMPIKPNSVVWGSLLAACKVHNDLDLAEAAVEKITELEPENRSYNILMSNAYANAKSWNNVAGMRTAVKDSKITKPKGQSSVEVGGSVHDFVVGDKAHPRSGEIYEMLTEMSARLKEAGYAPNTSAVYQNIEEEDKEAELNYHSEKLAIAFGLIGTAAGMPIRIVKNLRVCKDCHEVTKLLSKIYGRTITVRDRRRFHHFRDGSCSCGDYW